MDPCSTPALSDDTSSVSNGANNDDSAGGETESGKIVFKEPVKRSSGSGGGGGVLDATTGAITNPCCVLIQSLSFLPIKFYINNEVQSP